MGAVLLDRAVVGAQSIVGVGALVPQHFRVPEDTLVVGQPARVVRSLSRKEGADLRRSANKYVQLAREYRRRSWGRNTGPSLMGQNTGI